MCACVVTVGRRRIFFVVVGYVFAWCRCFSCRQSGDARPKRIEYVIRGAVDYQRWETKHVKSKVMRMEDRLDSSFIFCMFVCSCMAVAILCTIHTACICIGSRLAGTSLAKCYRNNNISIMYSKRIYTYVYRV